MRIRKQIALLKGLLENANSKVKSLLTNSLPFVMFQVFTAFRVALVKRETAGYYFVTFAYFRDLKNAAKFNAHEQ